MGYSYYTPSRFDRLLDKADELIRQGFSFVLGVDVPAFEGRSRKWAAVPARVKRGYED